MRARQYSFKFSYAKNHIARVITCQVKVACINIGDFTSILETLPLTLEIWVSVSDLDFRF